jgi:hypothetical protein
MARIDKDERMDAILPLRAVHFEEGVTVLLADSHVSVTGPGWSYTPRLEQEPDGLHRSQFRLPGPLLGLTDEQLIQAARDALDDYVSFRSRSGGSGGV